ncbi:MAG: right-handed parallel beta-helix repeat-containing protein, partial [Armatimonadetes bacterium]|nr:right-handed parallel beta-helix repeat-containing protein [Armatimonadota bacterium]
RLVEINVRRTVFYPDQPGRNYITVRGFIMRHAATPWAPPTAEQIGLIGTHWSKGWIIENCTISHSVCSGISLGKHGDEFDNTSANTAEGYVKTIERGLARGWNRETIGGHIVRDNAISHCEQTGIVGSLGAAFCAVTGNTIRDIHVRRLFSGAEMAGIKFHGAIDTVIADNHIYRTCLGLWLDWMAQGTRVTRNVFRDNLSHDLFVEVNHGPFVVDHNLFLSPASLLDVSQGGAYAHNLFLGAIATFPDLGRQTPYHPGHGTAVAGLSSVKGGDNRFINNLFVGGAGHGLWVYDKAGYPLTASGNVYYGGARPYANETGSVVSADHKADPRVVVRGRGVRVEITMGADLPASPTVTTATLGRARVSDLPYESADGSPIVLDRDFLGRLRRQDRAFPGPFAEAMPGRMSVRVR